MAELMPQGRDLFTRDLAAAVTDRIPEVSQWPVGRRVKEADDYADVIGSGADVLFATTTRAALDIEPERVKDAIVGGLAILAHRGDGVTFGGLHWCVNGHDGCPGPGQYTLTDATLSRSTRGAYFTPRRLAEEVTVGAFEAIFYRPGPAQTADRSKWQLVPSEEAAALTWSDIACGSGVFLLAGVRYQADRICEAQNVEAGLPVDEPASSAAVMAARRTAIQRMVGVDIDPLSVELSKLSVALLVPTVPVDLSRRIVCGDSLLGITSWAHILTVSLDPDAPPVFEPGEVRMLMLQVELEAFGSRLCQVSVEGRRLPFVLADLAVGHCLASAGKSRKVRVALNDEARWWARRVYSDPSLMDAAAAQAREWLDTDLPAGNPPRQPIHWPLLWPEIFGFGVPLPRPVKGAVQ